MISKPLVQRIAIFAFKKTKSNDSEGKKNSWQEKSQLQSENDDHATHPVQTEPLRPSRSYTKPRRERGRRLGSFVDLLDNRLENTEDTVELREVERGS